MESKRCSFVSGHGFGLEMCPAPVVGSMHIFHNLKPNQTGMRTMIRVNVCNAHQYELVNGRLLPGWETYDNEYTRAEQAVKIGDK